MPEEALLLTAGVARTIITPPIGIHLTGFAGRPPSTGIHDDLWATALVLAERVPGSAAPSSEQESQSSTTQRAADAGSGSEQDSRIALVTLDLLGLYGETLAPAIKARIQEVTGIPPERVLLSCSHTHYGPVVAGGVTGREGGDSPEAIAYREALPHHLAGIVAAADAARRPVSLAAGRGSVKAGINRRERRPDGRIVLGQNPEGALDSEVIVWRLDAADGPPPEPGAPIGWPRRSGQPVAVIVTYACHAVSLGGQMRLITADFPGVTRRVVEQLAGGTALFIQGAAGNINPSLMGPDWDHPRRLGHTLGAEAARVALLAQPAKALPLRLARERLLLPALLPPSVEAGRAQLAALEAERERLRQADPESTRGRRWWNEQRLERVRRGLAALEGGEPLPPIPAEVAALRLGDAALVTCPGELFCEIGMAIKRASPFTWTAVAGYTDGAVGYIPTREAYAEGGYEVESACRVNPEAGELVYEASVRLLHRLQ